MSKLIMGYWDCPFCGSKEIRGDVVNCPSCGRARGEVQFYVKGVSEGQLLSEEELNRLEHVDDDTAASISKNPDWYCSFCNSLNSDNAQFCGNCGASREDSESNYFQMLQKKKEKEAAEAAAQQQNLSQAPARQSRKALFIILAIVLAVAGIFVWMNGNKTGDYQVTSVSWVRNINVEENRMFSESGWELPQGAEKTSSRKEIHHYDNVLDHYETVPVQRSRQVFDHNEYTTVDNGNGTFSKQAHPVYVTETYTEYEKRPVYRQEPRYATKYYYNIWRWTPSRDVTASGEDHNAAWPEVTLGENEREGKRTEIYRFSAVNAKKQGETTVYRLAESDWMNVNVSDTLNITAKRTGANPFISDEKGNKIADLVREK